MSNASIWPGRFVSVVVSAVVAPNSSVPTGLGVGAALLVVTVTDADVAVLPAASRATAVRTCVPFVAVVVSHLAEQGDALSSAAIDDPSTLNVTPATTMLSLSVA